MKSGEKLILTYKERYSKTLIVFAILKDRALSSFALIEIITFPNIMKVIKTIMYSIFKRDNNILHNYKLFLQQ